jgi:antitoxin component YwqK of YwqJK toxin-antitoxin module
VKNLKIKSNRKVIIYTSCALVISVFLYIFSYGLFLPMLEKTSSLSSYLGYMFYSPVEYLRIKSYWIYYPTEKTYRLCQGKKTASKRSNNDKTFRREIHWHSNGVVSFDYLMNSCGQNGPGKAFYRNGKLREITDSEGCIKAYYKDGTLKVIVDKDLNFKYFRTDGNLFLEIKTYPSMENIWYDRSNNIIARSITKQGRLQGSAVRRTETVIVNDEEITKPLRIVHYNNGKVIKEVPLKIDLGIEGFYSCDE